MQTLVALCVGRPAEGDRSWVVGVRDGLLSLPLPRDFPFLSLPLPPLFPPIPFSSGGCLYWHLSPYAHVPLACQERQVPLRGELPPAANTVPPPGD